MVASEVRVGNIVKMDGKTCKVLSQEIRGTGKSAKTVHLKLRSLLDGHMIEKGIRGEEKVENVEVNRVKMQYLYADQGQFIFMNTETYEQYPISNKVVGKQSIFLKENSEIDILFEGEEALSIDFPKLVQLKVSNAPPPIKGGRDNTFKEVELENGLKVLAPQFVKAGDQVRVNVDDLTYEDRVTTKSMGGGKHEEKGNK